jgi:hypothetical protein
MNKKALFTGAAILAGAITSAVAQPHTVYLTGSTAYRSVVYAALRHERGNGTGSVFDGAGTNGAAASPTVLSGTDANSANAIVYDGWLNGVEYIINCQFTGSEVGIAAVAGVAQLDVAIPLMYNGGSNVATTPNLPGSPVFFLNPPLYNTNSTTSTQPDLSMADTSQAVSLTQSATLTDFGIVGIVPFVWAKGSNHLGAADLPWSHLVNLTHPSLFYEWSGSKPVSFFTGNVSETNNNVRLVGRNKGSGTRVNTALDLQFPSTSQPVQYCVFGQYTLQGGIWVLTYIGSPGVGNPQPFVDANVIATPRGDGYDSGAFVARTLECDGGGNTNIFIGYLGIGDAKTARDGTSGGPTAKDPGGAVWLTLDGVAENNGAVESGQYTFWGHEHLLGQGSGTISTDATTIGNALAGVTQPGLPAALGSAGSVATSSDTGIPVSLMHAEKASGDAGFPIPK